MAEIWKNGKKVDAAVLAECLTREYELTSTGDAVQIKSFIETSEKGGIA